MLKKNANKNVMFEEKPESRMKGLKLNFKKRNENRKRNLIREIIMKRRIIQEKHEIMKEGNK